MLTKPIKVSGLGGVVTYISAGVNVKFALGLQVVYVVDVWLANIGEGGLIQLPDEESVLLQDGPPHYVGRELSLCP
ncbi:hypothetical protein F443_11756 [Phytophthora nicotianae P1569]|uniref:Uncharacterized protein n=1 Tax=Phytophthora nicotianae P1569 TaxID=1317065 RepID=V9EV85_PHYNI|nr:hypothetical protein F443_11756 [Phytophthora nicotianae P1569]